VTDRDHPRRGLFLEDRVYGNADARAIGFPRGHGGAAPAVAAMQRAGQPQNRGWRTHGNRDKMLFFFDY